MMKRCAVMVVVSLLVVAWSGSLQAAFIFDNLHPDPASTGSTYVTNQQWYAQKFITDSDTYTLDSVTLWMKVGAPTDTAYADLYSDSGSNTPGIQLASVTKAAGSYPYPNLGASLFDFNYQYLVPASSYWIVFHPGSYGDPPQWSYTSTLTYEPDWAQTATRQSSDGGHSWGTAGAPVYFQMQVDADPLLIGQSVPEPSTIVLFGGILVGTLGFVRRRAKRTTPEAV